MKLYSIQLCKNLEITVWKPFNTFNNLRSSDGLDACMQPEMKCCLRGKTQAIKRELTVAYNLDKFPWSESLWLCSQ